MKTLLLILMIFIASCASLGPQRKVGSCLLSATHGGPYLLEAQDEDLKLRDPIRKGTMLLEFPNDQSWEEISCPIAW